MVHVNATALRAAAHLHQHLQAFVTHPSEYLIPHHVLTQFGSTKGNLHPKESNEEEKNGCRSHQPVSSLRVICFVPQVRTKSVIVTEAASSGNIRRNIFTDFKFIGIKMYFCMPFIIILFPQCCSNNQHELTTFNSLKDTLFRPQPASLSFSIVRN